MPKDIVDLESLQQTDCYCACVCIVVKCARLNPAQNSVKENGEMAELAISAKLMGKGWICQSSTGVAP